MNGFKVGPSFEYCDECGGDNGDGYGDITHRKNCSKLIKTPTDTERLNWLNDHPDAIYFAPSAFHGRMGGWTVVINNDEYPTLHDAIDAAIVLYGV